MLTTLLVYHVADESETQKEKGELDTVGEVRCSKSNTKFPLIENISRKDSKVLLFLFRKPRRERYEYRREVARSGEFGVSHEDIQCLCPRIPISAKEKARSSEGPSDVQISVASTIVDCRLQRFHRRLKHCIEIFIPLHDDIANHGFFLVIKLRRKIAELWDCVPECMSLTRRLEIAKTL
ncbi:uncharacterized protein LOC126787087 [Argentina anserina]|uniref:uncharacterized protein LOC126787087 n=1 Tax=Argentina anserina TaxID=57926 RepID=UPI00217677DB|nr:uncharacterized protein LOC126787087 [Potentilla anserina]